MFGLWNHSGQNSSSDGCSTSGGDDINISNAELEKLATVLASRFVASSGFHVLDFLLGVLLTCFIVYLVYKRSKSRLLLRNHESEVGNVLKHMDDEQIKRILGESNLPSWINYPDFERVGWLNTILSQLWPSINEAVSQQFREILAPLLRDNKPSWIASLKLFRFDLGDAAPQANGVKVYHQDDAKDQIMIEVDFTWVGSQDVQLTIKPIPKHLGPLSPAGHLLSSIVRLRAGIERITVNGRVRFIWAPLMDELPIIGGMQVGLVGMPSFTFDVTLYGGDVSIVPGLEAWLTTFMKDTVFRPYILPERYSMPFCPAAEAEEMKPTAILLLTAIKARHVPKMDLFSASDPYLRMFIRHSIQMKTSTIQNNDNPEWNEEFKLLVHDVDSQELTCILMDFDNYNPDDEIGRCALPIRDMEPKVAKEYWLDIDTGAVGDDADEGPKNKGLVDTVIAAEQKVADQGQRVWKKLPGVKNKSGKCQILLKATLYLLDSDDIEEMVESHSAAKHRAKHSTDQQEHENDSRQSNDEPADADTESKSQTREHDGDSEEEEKHGRDEQRAKRQDQKPSSKPAEVNGHAPESKSLDTAPQADTDQRLNHTQGNVETQENPRTRERNQGQPQGLPNKQNDASSESEGDGSSEKLTSKIKRKLKRNKDKTKDSREDEHKDSDMNGNDNAHESGDYQRMQEGESVTPPPEAERSEGVSDEARRAEEQRPKVEGKPVGSINDVDLKKQAQDALKGGVLEIRPKKATSLVRKPWYKASFLKSAAQLEMSVCGQFKKTASVPGRDPVFNESTEFLLGGDDIEDARNKTLKLEIWDHKLHLNSFRGGCSVPLKHILDAKRISNTMRLSGVRQGELTVDITWIPAYESGAGRGGTKTGN